METNSVNSLQNIINEKARRRLNEDIDRLAKSLKESYHILGDISVEVVIPESYRNINERQVEIPVKKILLTHFLTYFDEYVRNNRLEHYIKAETELFIREVEELRERLHNLENGIIDE